MAISFRGRNLKPIDPVKVGYVANVSYAVRVAMIYGRTRAVPAEGVTVPLKEKVNRARVTRHPEAARGLQSIAPRNASLRLKGATPVVTKARVGITVNLAASAKAVERAILFRDRPRVALAKKRVIPAVRSVGPVVIVDRANFRLTWFKAGKKITFPVAVGT